MGDVTPSPLPNATTERRGAMTPQDKQDLAACLAALHAAVTLGTANGLSLDGQELSLAEATAEEAGALSATLFEKLVGLAALYAVTNGNGLTLTGGALAMAAAGDGVAGSLNTATQVVTGTKFFKNGVGFTFGFITPEVGGGQENATQITARHTVAVMVGSDHDSIKLPQANSIENGSWVLVQNINPTKIVNLFPASGDNIGTLGTNVALEIPPQGALFLTAYGSVSWYVVSNSWTPGTSGANTGDVTLTDVGAAPNAQGASLSGQALTLQPASTSHPGVMTAAQAGLLQELGLRQSQATVAAAGSDQAGATGLTAGVNVIGSGSGGVRLPTPDVNFRRFVLVGNNTANTVKVYPSASGQIDTLAADAPFDLPAYTDALLLKTPGSSLWRSVPLRVGGTGNGLTKETGTGVLSLAAATNSSPGAATATQISAIEANTAARHDAVTLNTVGSTPNASGMSLSGQELRLQPASNTSPGAATAAHISALEAATAAQHAAVTLANVGSSPNAQGASLSGQALTLQPASTSQPGVMTAADKTNLDADTAARHAAVTLTTVGSSPNADGASLSAQALTLQPASPSHPGLLPAEGYNRLAYAAISAAGVNQAGATPIAASYNNITGGTGGVRLPAVNSDFGRLVAILNSSGGSRTVYPPSGGNIDGLAVDGGFALANNGRVILMQVPGTDAWISVPALNATSNGLSKANGTGALSMTLAGAFATGAISNASQTIAGAKTLSGATQINNTLGVTGLLTASGGIAPLNDWTGTISTPSTGWTVVNSVQFRRHSDGTVHMRGYLTGSGITYTSQVYSAANGIPAAFRPGVIKRFPVNAGGNHGQLIVDPSGEIVLWNVIGSPSTPDLDLPLTWVEGG